MTYAGVYVRIPVFQLKCKKFCIKQELKIQSNATVKFIFFYDKWAKSIIAMNFGQNLRNSSWRHIDISDVFSEFSMKCDSFLQYIFHIDANA